MLIENLISATSHPSATSLCNSNYLLIRPLIEIVAAAKEGGGNVKDLAIGVCFWKQAELEPRSQRHLLQVPVAAPAASASGPADSYDYSEEPGAATGPAAGAIPGMLDPSLLRKKIPKE